MKNILITLILLATFNIATAENKKDKQIFKINEAELNETQQSLLDNYLQNNDFSQEELSLDLQPRYDVVIYNTKSQVVFSGSEQDAYDLLQKSALITTYNKTKNYIIVE